MSATTKRKRPQMDVREDPKSGWERYIQGAGESGSSGSIDTFYAHANADGNVWLLSYSSARIETAEDLARVREESIQSWMAIPVTLVFRNGERFTYHPSREEAEQHVDYHFGVWPPVRMICASSADAVATLERRHGPLVPSVPQSIAA